MSFINVFIYIIVLNSGNNFNFDDMNHKIWKFTFDNGSQLQEQGKLKQAEWNLRAALLCAVAFDEIDPRYSATLEKMGWIFFMNGKYIEAKAYAQKALTCRINFNINDNANIELFRLYYLTACCQKSSKDFINAKTNFIKAIDIQNFNNLSMSIDASNCYIELMEIALAEQKFDIVNYYFEKVLEIYNKNIENNSPEMANLLHKLSRHYFIAGKLQISEQLIKQCIKIRSNTHNNNPLFINTINSAIAIYLSAGKTNEVQDLIKKYNNVFIINLDNKIEIGAFYFNCGVFFQGTGELNESKLYFNKAINVWGEEGRKIYQKEFMMCIDMCK